MNTTPDPAEPIRIPGIPGVPAHSRFAYEPQAHRTVPTGDLQPGDRFVYRPSPHALPETVEVVRIDTLHRSGQVRLWAYRDSHNRSLLTPFNAGTYPVTAQLEVP